MIFLNLFDRLIKKKDVYFKFSTDEQWTGEYWLDGKKIYTKTFYTSTSGNAEVKINHGISNIGTFRSFDLGNSFWFNKSSNQAYPLNTYVNASSWSTSYTITNTQLQMNYGANFVTDWGLYITIRYTKTTD